MSPCLCPAFYTGIGNLMIALPQCFAANRLLYAPEPQFSAHISSPWERQFCIAIFCFLAESLQSDRTIVCFVRKSAIKVSEKSAKQAEF